jgi:hypothetical protein
MTAVARALQEQGAEPVLASMSAALPLVLEATGLRGEYIPGPGRSWVDPRRWQQYAAERLVALAREVRAEVVVYDGVAPYDAVLRARAALCDVAFTWVRRGMWRHGANRRALWTAPAFDLIIEPGDLCASADNGATVGAEALRVPPISLAGYWPTVDAREARPGLGLDPGRPAALVMLYASAGGDMAGPGRAAVAAILANRDWQVAVTELPLRDSASWLLDQDRIVQIRGVFPLAPILGTFDLAVTGAGYNAVHELLPAGVPTVLVAKQTATDDQVARAFEADRRGWAVAARDDQPREVADAVTRLLEVRPRARLAAACADLPALVGAPLAATAVLELGRRFRRHSVSPAERAARAQLQVRSALRARVGRWSPTAAPRMETRVGVGDLMGDTPVEQVLEGASAAYLASRRALVRRVWPGGA